jgi:hypothetical protein
MAGDHQEADSDADGQNKEAASRHFLKVVVHGEIDLGKMKT